MMSPVLSIFVFLISWSVYAQGPAPASAPASVADAPPSTGEAIEIACLHLKNAGACEVATRRASMSRDGEVFARVGCDELKSARSCAQLGDGLAAARAKGAGDASIDEAKVTEVYARGCAADSVAGCSRLIERWRTANAANFGTAVTVDSAKVDQTVGFICAGAAATSASCAAARDAQAELVHRADPAYAACRVDAQIFRASASGTTLVTLPPSGTVVPPLTHEQCAVECQKLVDQYRVDDESALQLRGRCTWGAVFEPKAIWRLLTSNKVCPATRKLMGEADAPMFPLCHCERAILPAANDLAATLGAYVRSDVAFSKRFGAETWYRCGASAYFDEAARRSPECATNAKILARKLATEPSLREFQLNVKTLTCEGASK